MGKITYLQPRRSDVRPILVLRTSHRIDCFLVCIRCLERFTDFASLSHIYVLADTVNQDHVALVRRFAARHDNTTVIERGPHGSSLAMRLAQNALYLRHIDNAIVTLDETIFVTPLWLEHLLDGYREHLARPDVPLVMPLVPISPAGRHVLNGFLRVAYPSEHTMYCGAPIEENWTYHRWIWEKLLYENMADIYLHDRPAKYAYVGHASANCLLLDRRILERLLPFPENPGPLAAQELAINTLLHEDGLKAVVLGRSLAHHYSYPDCESYLRTHVPLERIWRYVQGTPDAPTSGLRAREANGRREMSRLRVSG